MAVTYTKDEMRKRFDAANAERDVIAKKVEPMRKEWDALQQQIQALEAKAKPLMVKIKEIEAPLFDLDMERSLLARALGGRATSDAA